MPRLPFPACFAALALAVAALPALADEPAVIRELLARGDATAALQRAQKAVAANARDAQSRFLVGVALMDLQRDTEALEHFTAMTQQYPDLPDPLNNIALLQARAGRLELARLALVDALRADPSHRLARANLGQVHLLLAVQAWEQAAAQGPLETAVQRRLDAVRALLASRGEPAPVAAR